MHFDFVHKVVHQGPFPTAEGLESSGDFWKLLYGSFEGVKFTVVCQDCDGVGRVNLADQSGLASEPNKHLVDAAQLRVDNLFLHD